MRTPVVIALAVTLLLAAMLVGGCAKKTAPPPAPPVGQDMSPPPPEAGPTPATGGEAATGEKVDAAAVAEKTGAPVYDGATAESAEATDGATKAVFTTTDAYAKVKEFYLGKLKEPDWKNNGFEMGAMGGDTWEFKSADETKLVTVSRDSGATKTTVTFTVKEKAE